VGCEAHTNRGVDQSSMGSATLIAPYPRGTP
jgi:hypothetical protein